ncbi:MAG: hypothetical protein P4L46_26285 [Fimbriimonas sp.]|nr:hypothetical protein [Fimbriimonas sp.]
MKKLILIAGLAGIVAMANATPTQGVAVTATVETYMSVAGVSALNFDLTDGATGTYTATGGSFVVFANTDWTVSVGTPVNPLGVGNTYTLSAPAVATGGSGGLTSLTGSNGTVTVTLSVANKTAGLMPVPESTTTAGSVVLTIAATVI